MNHDELKDLIANLRNERKHSDELCYNAADELEEMMALLERQQVIIRRIYAEHLPNTWFVAGEMGKKDENGLPERIEVCPAYGCDWTQIYERTPTTIGGMGS